MLFTGLKIVKSVDQIRVFIILPPFIAQDTA
jgi:hypothetical protein